MLNQRTINSLNRVFGVVFIIFGAIILILGISLVLSKEKSSVEYGLMIAFLSGGILMIWGGVQYILTANEKDKAVDSYELQVMRKLNDFNSDLNSHSENKADAPGQTETGVNTPDIIAKWEYTKEEWKHMNQEERRRRIKEGVWFSLLIGVVGGWLLTGRGETFLFGFLFSLAVGVLISLLKIFISNKQFSVKRNNTVLITTNALIINGTFKVINDEFIKLKQIELIKLGADEFIEFSIIWPTRKGVIDDQLRIFVPPNYKNEAEKVLNYYKDKGVTTIKNFEEA